MRRTSLRTLALTCGFAFATVAILATPKAVSQTGEGWTVLLDGKTMGDWEKTNETNWRLEDGAVVADKKPEKGTAHLVSKQKYKDFQLHVEFWASDDANSGIFIRCAEPKDPGARNCYEINIYDTAPNKHYGTGSIVNFSEVDPMPKAGGKWNTYEITAKGRHITAVLNGQKTADLRNGLFVEGPITLQYGGGVIKFRKVAIKPM